MSNWKIGIEVNKKMPLEDLALLKDIGFDSYFICRIEDRELMSKVSEAAASYGLTLTSIHAPFKRIAKIWEDSEEGDDVMGELERCIEDCAYFGAPVLVSHPFIGFKDHTPTPIGLARYRKLGAFAMEKGVKIAIENVEGEEYLDYLLPNLRDIPSIGFCLDTGHEICYNRGRDLLADYGDMLCYLHIDSNLGITDPAGEITFYDDSHLLPFDGVVDMEFLAKRLKKLNFKGHLTMELNQTSRPGRTDNDIYAHMSRKEYFEEAFRRGKRLAELLEKN